MVEVTDHQHTRTHLDGGANIGSISLNRSTRKEEATTDWKLYVQLSISEVYIQCFDNLLSSQMCLSIQLSVFVADNVGVVAINVERFKRARTSQCVGWSNSRCTHLDCDLINEHVRP